MEQTKKMLIEKIAQLEKTLKTYGQSEKFNYPENYGFMLGRSRSFYECLASINHELRSSDPINTPLKDKHTKENLLIGDRVQNEKTQCGKLHWDDTRMKYVIKSDEGGNIPFATIELIDELHDNNIGSEKTESRNNPNKKRW